MVESILHAFSSQLPGLSDRAEGQHSVVETFCSIVSPFSESDKELSTAQNSAAFQTEQAYGGVGLGSVSTAAWAWEIGEPFLWRIWTGPSLLDEKWGKFWQVQTSLLITTTTTKTKEKFSKEESRRHCGLEERDLPETGLELGKLQSKREAVGKLRVMQTKRTKTA